MSASSCSTAMAQVVDLQPPRAGPCLAHPCGCCRWPRAAVFMAGILAGRTCQARAASGIASALRGRRTGFGRLPVRQPLAGGMLALGSSVTGVAAGTFRANKYSVLCVRPPARNGGASAGRSRRRFPVPSRSAHAPAPSRRRNRYRFPRATSRCAGSLGRAHPDGPWLPVTDCQKSAASARVIEQHLQRRACGSPPAPIEES